MQGTFITFEGIEGVGKSTLQTGLAKALKKEKYNVLVTREPGGTTLGEKLRDAILTTDHGHVTPAAELLVMFAARAQHIDSCVKPALDEGKIILCDRFTDTTRAYQGGGRRLPEQWIDHLVAMTHPDLQPDITFWLDLPVEQALERTKKRATADRIEQEKLDFFTRVQEAYKQLAASEPHRIIRLDASHPPHILVQECLEMIKTILLP